MNTVLPFLPATSASLACVDRANSISTGMPMRLATAGRLPRVGSLSSSGIPSSLAFQYSSCLCPRLGIRLVAENFALPERVIRILNREFFPADVLTLQSRGVGGAHIAPEGDHGPPVTGDVVEGDQKDVLVRTLLEQLGPERNFLGQVEGDSIGLAERVRHLWSPHIFHHQGWYGLGGLKNVLMGFPVGLPEHRAQRLVTGDQIAQCPLKRFPVE